VVYPFRGPKYVADTAKDSEDKTMEPPSKKSRIETTDTGA